MLPSISFETGGKTQIQSSEQLQKLHQQMEVWFYIEWEPRLRSHTHAAKNQKNYTRAPP